MPSNPHRRAKPAKPSKTFPLTPHNNGQWCKKIRGEVHFFGVWEDPQAALQNYLSAAADLHAGRLPRQSTLSQGAITVKDVGNAYLAFQHQKVQDGRIGAGSFADCLAVVRSLAQAMGPTRAVSDLRPADFEAYRSQICKHGMTGSSKGLGAHAEMRAISITRSMFNYAYEAELIEHPMRFGPGFKKPSATQMRKARSLSNQQSGKRLFEPADIRAILKAADMPLRAMALLGINGGLGNTDCARLPISAVDLKRGVIEFDRPKTGIERVVPLWPETADALRLALRDRPKPVAADAEGRVFVTAYGRAWARESIHRDEKNLIQKVIFIDAIGLEFNRLLEQLDLKRSRIGFYTLRHTFRTWADEVKDQHAVFRIMGHTIPGMAGPYVERIELPRLRAVVRHVRKKVFPPARASGKRRDRRPAQAAPGNGQPQTGNNG